MLATVPAGCAAASILQLAPVGIEAVGVGASAVTGAADAPHEPGRKDDETDAEYHERCEDLEQTVPTVIEIHTVKDTGVAQWRELRIANRSSSRQWVPTMPDTPSTWQPMARLYAMQFAPPLEPPPPGKSTFLAYAPADPLSEVEAAQLASLNTNFGSNSGTFKWSERVYDYGVVKKLPCFPPPSIALK